MCQQEQDCDYRPRQHVASSADKGGVNPSDTRDGGVGSGCVAAAAVSAAPHSIPGESNMIDFDPFEDAVAATPAHVSPCPRNLLQTASGGVHSARQRVGAGIDKSRVGTDIIDDLLGLVSYFLP